MLLKLRAILIRDPTRSLGRKIEIHLNRSASRDDSAILPGFMQDIERGVPYFFNPCLNADIAAIVNLRHEVYFDASQNNREFLYVHPGGKDTEYRFSCRLKPTCNDSVVDVTKRICFVKPWGEICIEHRFALP